MRLPTTISVEITNQCNLRCIMCLRMDSKWKEMNSNYPPFMDLELFKEIVDQYNILNPNKQKALLPHFQGEPLLHKDILKICDYLNYKEISFGLTTNATLLTKEISIELSKMKYFNSIAFSVDGITKNVYEEIRVGANYEKTIENINTFLLEKKDYTSVYMNYVIQECNKNETDKYIKHWIKNPKILGVYTNIKSKDYKPISFNFIPERISCEYYNFYMIIATNGEVYACGKDVWKENKIGKFPEQNLDEIWNGLGLRDLGWIQDNKDWDKNSFCKDCSCWMYRIAPIISKENGIIKSVFPFTTLYTK